MIPFGEFGFFLPVIILAIPAIILGLKGRTIRWYNLIISIYMVYNILSGMHVAREHFLLFFVFEWFIIKGYSYLRQRKNLTVFYFLALIGSFLPLVFEKRLIPGINFIGFLGISYLTFKCVQMVMEIKDGLIEKVKFFDFASFMFFFPTLSSGPIDRFRRFTKDLATKPSGEEYRELLLKGIQKIFLGFLYKFIIGFLVKTYWLDPIGSSHSFLTTMNYMYAYTMYLFFDFAGYSSFAVGTSYVLAIRTPDNFNKPFISSSIKDFWNRWHMTLSTWFRDYVYMRLIYYFVKKKIRINKYVLSYIGYFLLFGLMGLWHGSDLFYIVYGLYHAVMMTGFDVFSQLNKDWKLWGSGKGWNLLSILVTFHFVCFGFLIFSGHIGYLNWVLLLIIIPLTILLFMIQIIQSAHKKLEMQKA
ncbi:MAG TPA: D-alanyl-lipoteichoic acid biosynthesis protein DltB [Firmicutes bacterium]|jgi:membrane protein involved in D-alanine export|nr:D-alanyl-lipoteichoic acid biosynthesis protein DltB [Bacillota bacterium]